MHRQRRWAGPMEMAMRDMVIVFRVENGAVIDIDMPGDEDMDAEAIAAWAADIGDDVEIDGDGYYYMGDMPMGDGPYDDAARAWAAGYRAAADYLDMAYGKD